MKIAISTWSAHRSFEKKEMILSKFPEFCVKEFGIYFIEVVDSHLASKERKYLKEIKEILKETDTKIACLAIGNDFTIIEEKVRKKQIENVKKWFKIANYLNIPTLRVNAGWKDDKDKNAIKRVVSSFKELIPYAKKYSVRMALENHGGITSNLDNIVTIVRRVSSTYFGTCPDFGNFPDKIRYSALKKVSPYALHVHAKSHEFSEEGEEKKIDYKKVIKILKNNNYQGYLSIEFEGEGDEIEGIKYTKNLIEKYL